MSYTGVVGQAFRQAAPDREDVIMVMEKSRRGTRVSVYRNATISSERPPSGRLDQLTVVGTVTDWDVSVKPFRNADAHAYEPTMDAPAYALHIRKRCNGPDVTVSYVPVEWDGERYRRTSDMDAWGGAYADAGGLVGEVVTAAMGRQWHGAVAIHDDLHWNAA